MFMRKFVSYVIILLGMNLYSQDPVFTQFYNIPESLNPGFAGASFGTEMGVLNRTQWFGLNYGLSSQFFSIDGFSDKMNSGLGMSILNHQESTTRYNFTQINFNYAYEVKLNDTWFFRPSIAVGVGSKNFGFQNILLEDQINIFSGFISTTSIDPSILEDNVRFFDYSASVLFMKERSWIGATIRHLNKPNISLVYNENAALDMFMSVHGYLELPILKRDYSSRFYLTANGMKQGEYNRLDFGSQYVYDERFSFAILAAW